MSACRIEFRSISKTKLVTNCAVYEYFLIGVQTVYLSCAHKMFLKCCFTERCKGVTSFEGGGRKQFANELNANLGVSMMVGKIPCEI